jgi:DNA-binding MarR family transcriptional regulator
MQRAGPNDRRQRLLYATSKGESLVLRLAGLQTARIGRALAALSASDIAALRLFLRGMIDQDDGDPVLQAILQAPPVAEREER